MNSSLSFGEESGIPPVPELPHHPKETEIDLQKLATDFIGDSEHRLKIFGKPKIDACM